MPADTRNRYTQPHPHHQLHSHGPPARLPRSISAPAPASMMTNLTLSSSSTRTIGGGGPKSGNGSPTRVGVVGAIGPNGVMQPKAVENFVLKCREFRDFARTIISSCAYRERRRRSAELTIPSGSSQGSSPSPTCHHRLSPNEWTFAFDSMIRSEDGRLAFTDFLKSEYSDENIMFWWAVQQLRSSNANEDEFACQVRQMYDLYIAADSPHAINIDHDTRTEIIDRVEGAASAEPFPEDIYDRAQTHVYRLMEKDCFSRFVHTATYKELAKKLHLPQSFRFNGRTSPL